MKKTKFRAQFDKRPVRDGVFPCDALLPGDGTDPRYDRDEHKRVPNRKALQLCAQVADLLNISLPGMSDEWLRELYVVSVQPAPDSSQLLVVVSSLAGCDEMKVNERLLAASGALRAEVARGINRKRVPNLKFRYVKSILNI